MWRHVLSGFGALLIGGCTVCDDDYRCVTRYDPYYGYYNDCGPSGHICKETHPRPCTDGRCDEGVDQPCTRDSECGTGHACNAQGMCVGTSAGSGGASAGAPGGSAGSVAPSSGGETADAGALPGAGDTGGRSGAAGASGSGAHAGNGASSSGGAAGSAGHAGSGTGAASGGRAANGGASSAGGRGGTSAGGAAATGGSATGGAASGGRVHRLDFACVRDTQCGAGECASGTCYVACESDEECGTGDRCSVETGRRICMPDPNPAVRCDESAICRVDQTCVNGSCHDPCNQDTDCANLQDRCTNHLCFPDRRPIAECVLNVECAADLVCLDGRCVTFGGD